MIDDQPKQHDLPVRDDEFGKGGEKAGQEESPPGARSDLKEDAELTEEDALAALRRGGGDEEEHAEATLAATIAARVTERLQRDPQGMRVDTLVLFNETVRFGGGFNIADQGRRTGELAMKINKARLARWTERFVPPHWFDGALDIVRGHRLLILALPPGGRKAAGFNLLAEVLEESTGGEYYRLVGLPATDEAKWTPPTTGSAYLLVLDDSSPRSSGLTVDSIDEEWIDEMTTSLNEADSFMVVVAGRPRGALVEAAARSQHIMTPSGQVDLVRIVQSHVFDSAPEPEEVHNLHRRLADAGALDLLREAGCPRLAVRLASMIRQGEDLEAGVTSLRDPSGQVHAWFSQHRSPETTSFALAAATLEEATYLTVSDAATALYGMLTPAPDSPPDLRFRDRLESDYPWIRVSVTSGDTGSSTFPALPRVRFNNPLVQQAMLGYAWTYLDGHRPAFLTWLRGLVTHPDIDVRARAGVAAGVIAWSDYAHALHRYLRPWAGSASSSLRQGAVTALGVVGANPDLAEATWDLLESWTEGRNTPFQRRLSLTAAATLGGQLGARQPERAVKALHAMLDRDDWRPLLPVSRSMLSLVEQGCGTGVLSALLRWSAPQDSSAMVTKALSIFVFIVRRPVPGESPDDMPLPFLLTHTGDHLPQLVELWARALARKPAQTQALDVLREYLETYAEHDHAALISIRSLLLGVAARPGRQRERLEYHLGEWARSRKNPSSAVTQILIALRRSA